MNAHARGARGLLGAFWISLLFGAHGAALAQDRGSSAVPRQEIDVSKQLSDFFGEKTLPHTGPKKPPVAATPLAAPKPKPAAPPQVFRDESGYFEVLAPPDMAHWSGVRTTTQWALYDGVAEYSGVAFIRRHEALKKPWKSFAVHHLEKGVTVDFIRLRVTERVASLNKKGLTAYGPYDVPVGADGALGVGCSWAAHATHGDTLWTYEEVFVVCPTGTWNIMFAYEDKDDRFDLVQMRHSLKFLIPHGADVALVLPHQVRTARVSEYFGLRWGGKEDDEQCGWAARQFAEWYLGHALPSSGPEGVKRWWSMETPGYRKIKNNGRAIPPVGALLLWNGRVREPGHVAVVLAANPQNRWVRVIDCNSRSDRRGYIREVSLHEPHMLGWLVRE